VRLRAFADDIKLVGRSTDIDKCEADLSKWLKTIGLTLKPSKREVFEPDTTRLTTLFGVPIGSTRARLDHASDTADAIITDIQLVTVTLLHHGFAAQAEQLRAWPPALALTPE